MKDYKLKLGNLRVSHTLLTPKLTIKLDRLIVLSESSLLVWFLHVSLIVIIKGRSPMEVPLIVIINQVWAWLSLVIKPFSPLLSQPFQVWPWFTGPNRWQDKNLIYRLAYNLRSSHPTPPPPWLPSDFDLRVPPIKKCKNGRIFGNSSRLFWTCRKIEAKAAAAPSPDAVGGRITLSHTFVAPTFTTEVSLLHQVCQVVCSKESPFSVWMFLCVKSVWMLTLVRTVGVMCKWNPTSCVRAQKWFTEMNPLRFIQFGSLCESD